MDGLNRHSVCGSRLRNAGVVQRICAATPPQTRGKPKRKLRKQHDTRDDPIGHATTRRRRGPAEAKAEDGVDAVGAEIDWGVDDDGEGLVDSLATKTAEHNATLSAIRTEEALQAALAELKDSQPEEAERTASPCPHPTAPAAPHPAPPHHHRSVCVIA